MPTPRRSRPARRRRALTAVAATLCLAGLALSSGTWVRVAPGPTYRLAPDAAVSAVTVSVSTVPAWDVARAWIAGQPQQVHYTWERVETSAPGGPVDRESVRAYLAGYLAAAHRLAPSSAARCGRLVMAPLDGVEQGTVVLAWRRSDGTWTSDDPQSAQLPTQVLVTRSPGRCPRDVRPVAGDTVVLASPAHLDLEDVPAAGSRPALAVTSSWVSEVGERMPGVTGPSAGLAWALAWLDRASSGALTAGTAVAATGTITARGAVGPVYGSEMKAASLEPGTLFLRPAGPGPGTAVKTLADAVDAVCSQPHRAGPCPSAIRLHPAGTSAP